MNQSGSGNTQQSTAHGGVYASEGGQMFNAHNQFIVNGNPRDNENEKDSCLRALFLTDPRDDREKLLHSKGPRVDGTCEWIKRHPLYEEWLRSTSQLLWVSGGPGKGKSMIAIYLATELEQLSKFQDTCFLQYFCDDKDKKRNTAVTILRGLIYQILQTRRSIFHHILPSFRVQKDALFSSSSFDSLWRIFQDMTCDPILENIYCVMDGLDECDEASIQVLLNKFATLFSAAGNRSSTCQLKMIVLSRDLPEFVPDILSSFPRIHLDSDAKTEVNVDINQFITVKVDELAAKRNYPRQLTAHVKEVFWSRAEGTFLWIGIVAKSLQKYKWTQVEKALELFPPGLDGLYARILLEIPHHQREMAARILRWVVVAVRPLTLSELGTAVEATAGLSTSFGWEEAIKDFVSYCGYFLTIEGGKVNLIHQSTKDYLLRREPDSNSELEAFRILEGVANLEIASRCFYYLQDGAFANGPVNLEYDIKHLEAFPLLSYATLHWSEHSRNLSCSEDIFDLSHPFYNEESEIRRSWIETYRTTKENFWDLQGSFTPLHLASHLGILPLVENILCMNTSTNRTNGLKEFNNPRQTTRTWAASDGCKTTTQMLLGNGADIEAKDDEGKTAMMCAAMRGHKAVMLLLLEKGADIDARDDTGKQALILAAVEGQESVMELLLKAGAKIETKCDNGKTALIYACCDGGYSAVLKLLELGADIEAKDNQGKTALIHATLEGEEATMELLLENRADIEVRDNEGKTTLIWAAFVGNKWAVELLLEEGAKIEAKDDQGRTALICAASREMAPHWLAKCYASVVQLLLDKGAKIEAKDVLARTALIWAAFVGNKWVVQLLLEKGAKIEAKDVLARTALIWAAFRGQASVVQLLLEIGASIEVKDDEGKTALIWASRNRHKATVKLLLDNGADIEARDHNRKTALIYATSEGYKATTRLLQNIRVDIEANDTGKMAQIWAALEKRRAVIHLLIDNGVDSRVHEDYFRLTALISKARDGNLKAVQLLLEEGVDIDVSDCEGKTALIWAAFAGHESVAQLLLEKGVDIELSDCKGMVALIWAAFAGYESMVQLLLEKGAKIEAKDVLARTALIWAAFRGHASVVQLLLGKGANVEAQDDHGRTALIHAACGGDEMVTKLLLLPKGEEIEARNENEKRAMMWAALSGHRGADIQAIDHTGKTALMWAALNGRETVVQVLLENEAEIEAKDYEEKTALIWASWNGQKATVQLLLENGAEINAKCGGEKTALIYANQSGHDGVAQLIASWRSSSSQGPTA
ncbi:MAG: hypothetical protein M1829_002114 [Trizodia sp. TS-e1964]|nr:MAG: hypothetical protein M1829_002114 [Trizodia sp. TS-e1964]